MKTIVLSLALVAAVAALGVAAPPEKNYTVHEWGTFTSAVTMQ
jgi:hypothetical protein